MDLPSPDDLEFPHIQNLFADRGSIEDVDSKSGHAIEIGTQAVWSVSSCKSGYGVTHLRDDSMDTYWQ